MSWRPLRSINAGSSLHPDHSGGICQAKFLSKLIIEYYTPQTFDKLRAQSGLQSGVFDMLQAESLSKTVQSQ